MSEHQGGKLLNIVHDEANQLSPHFFDLIVVDESHRSIYNTDREILDYFNAIVCEQPILAEAHSDTTGREVYTMVFCWPKSMLDPSRQLHRKADSLPHWTVVT